MNYLVTGGAGFIGSALVKKLIDLGNEVTIIDNLSTGFIDNIPNQATFIKSNIQNQSIYDELSNKKFDAIYHIAGQSSGEISFDDPVNDLQTNTQSTLMLLDFAIKNNCKRFLYASSMSVYGDKPDRPISENESCSPKSFYGVGKMASEHYLRIFKEFNINSTALRLFNVYGPGQNMSNLRQGMVSIFLQMALKNKFVLIKGSLSRFRDFIFIDDVVNAFINIENNPNSYNKVYNIGSGKRTEINELIGLFEKLLPFDIDYEVKGNTSGDQHGIYPNINQVLKDINWNPKVSLEHGLAKMINFYI